MPVIYSMLSEAKAQSFSSTPPVAVPSKAPMNRWSPSFLNMLTQTPMSADAQEGDRIIQ
jgi:hypothetical protein